MIWKVLPKQFWCGSAMTQGRPWFLKWPRGNRTGTSQRSGDDWCIKIDYDPAQQIVSWKIDAAKVKNLEFAQAMLDLAKDQIEHAKRQIHAQQALQMAQQAQHDAMFTQQVRNGVRRR